MVTTTTHFAFADYDVVSATTYFAFADCNEVLVIKLFVHVNNNGAYASGTVTSGNKTIATAYCRSPHDVTPALLP